MKRLEILISSDGTEATFIGDTFVLKDNIKSTGKARWDPVKKHWHVSGLLFDLDALQGLFPGAEIKAPEDLQNSNFVPAPSSVSVPDENEENPSSNISPNKASPSLGTSGAASVSELSALIRSVITRQFPGEAKVYGLVSSLKILTNGRVYFDLIDIEKKDCSIRCVVWENSSAVLSSLEKAGFSLEDDLPVLLGAQISLNQKNVQLSLSVLRFVPEYTLGKIQAEREKTNQRLKSEGLFDRNKKAVLPLLPKRLGVLTSQGGTVINDFKASLEVSKFGFMLFWYPVRVQGKGALAEILKGIKYFDKDPSIDAILLFRGGGSASELSMFNQYEIAKAICSCSKPVFTAIGHEHDQSSAQDVSFIHLGVPKDLGRYFSDIVIDLRTRVSEAKKICIKESRIILDSNEIAVRSTLQKFRYECTSFLNRKGSILERSLVVIKQSLSILAQTSYHQFSLLGQKIHSKGKEYLRERLGHLRENGISLKSLGGSRISEEKSRLSLLLQKISSSSSNIERSSEISLHRYHSFPSFSYRILTEIEKEVRAHDNLLLAVSPEQQLKRGFALIRDQSGEAYYTTLSSLTNGGEFIIQMRDGEGLITFNGRNKKQVE